MKHKYVKAKKGVEIVIIQKDDITNKEKYTVSEAGNILSNGRQMTVDIDLRGFQILDFKKDLFSRANIDKIADTIVEDTTEGLDKEVDNNIKQHNRFTGVYPDYSNPKKQYSYPKDSLASMMIDFGDNALILIKKK